MKRRNWMVLGLCAALAAGVPSAAFAEEASEAVTEAAAEEATEAAAEAAAEEAGNVLSAPTDFTIDPLTGEYSFTTTDERMGYYFIRVYQVDADGNETGDYAASSKRINGGDVGEKTGTVDLSSLSWGSYHVNLVSFAPAGTDYESPESLTLTANYGVGLTFECPELMVMTSGNQAEVIIDWYTLADYASYQYLPDMKITFYSDAECTQEVLSDTVDLSTLPDQNGYEYLPPADGYVWGWLLEKGDHLYTLTTEDMQGGSTEMSISFINDVYTYNLDAGTYYVTCQAISKDDFCLDSQVSEALEITLTDEESSADYTAVKSSMWTDPIYGMERVYAGAGTQESRVDYAAANGVSGELAE